MLVALHKGLHKALHKEALLVLVEVGYMGHWMGTEQLVVELVHKVAELDIQADRMVVGVDRVVVVTAAAVVLEYIVVVGGRGF